MGDHNSELEKICSVCSTGFNKEGYSKAHWKKDEASRKCKKCTGAENPQAMATEEGGGDKKKTKKKKKKGGSGGPGGIRLLGETKVPKGQTEPPTVPVSKLFAKGSYIKVEEQAYPENQSWRVKDTEKIALENTWEDTYDELRKAAEVHRQVRQYAQRIIKPGMSLADIAITIEDAVRVLVEENGLKAGVGFPCGVSINECAAHYTPNPGEAPIYLQPSDVMKVDFGVHVNGRIIDSAFTWCQDPKFDDLLAAVKDATETGIRAAGIDARLCDIGAEIQEAMESYEVEINGKVRQVKSITNLNGHSIEPYRIHGCKSVPMVAGGSEEKMVEGEFYAIETFGSTGQGRVWEHGESSHFSKNFSPTFTPLKMQKAKKLLSHIDKTFSTLPFCRRWIDRTGFENHGTPLNHLVEMGLVDAYPPLVDEPGSYVAQYEHTLCLKPTCKEIFSRGDDY